MRPPSPALIITLLALCAGMAAAEKKPASLKVVTAPSKSGISLTVGGKLIAVFRVPNGTTSPERRAQIAADRLKELIPSGLADEEVDARPRGEGWAVYVRGGLLMVATPAEAAERKETPEAVARRWAVNLKSVLKPSGNSAKAGSKPQKAVAAVEKTAPKESSAFGVAESELAVPAGETRWMSVTGVAPGTFTVKTDDQQTAVARVVDGKKAVVVAGLAPGKATITVTSNGKDVSFTAWVKKWAGAVTSTPEGQVTGLTSPLSFVRRAAEQFMLDGISREPGTVVKVSGPPTGLKALGRGESAQVVFPITISGEGYLTAETKVTVKVSNTVLPKEEAAFLLYSNDPESVREYGTLYEGAVSSEGPVRLLYHHQNRMGRPFLFQLQLINPGSEAALIQIIEGDAGPFIEPMQCGHRAGQKYLAAAMQDQGYVLRIAARSVRTIYSTMLPNLESVSGIYGLRILEGEDLVAHVQAVAEAKTPEIGKDLLEAAREEPHIYPSPKKDLKYEYSVGDKWTFMPIGKQPITGTNRARKLFGNYGVLYNISLKVNNPTNEMRTVRVVMAPEAGWARGVFVIDGKLIEAPQLAPPAEADLFSCKLGPGESRRVSIQGIPTGGSAYPLSLVVRP